MVVAGAAGGSDRPERGEEAEEPRAQVPAPGRAGGGGRWPVGLRGLRSLSRSLGRRGVALGLGGPDRRGERDVIAERDVAGRGRAGDLGLRGVHPLVLEQPEETAFDRAVIDAFGLRLLIGDALGPLAPVVEAERRFVLGVRVPTRFFRHGGSLRHRADA